MANDVILEILNSKFHVSPDFKMVEYIEDECGSLVSILNKMQSNEWRVRDVLTILHIMVCHTDENTIEFDVMADDVIKQGVTRFFDPIIKCLRHILFGADRSEPPGSEA